MRSILFIWLTLLALFSGCSLEVPEKAPNLTIHLEESSNAHSLELFESLAEPAILANPGGTSDFNCFTANITGSGITPDPQLSPLCSSSGNFQGRGFGVMPRPAVRGTPIQALIPPGNRRIDIYGFYPNSRACNGSHDNVSGYYLGGVTRDVLENTAISIPISFVVGSTADMTCTDASQAITYAYYLYAVNFTSNNVSAYSFNTSTGALTPVSGSPFAAGTAPKGVVVTPAGSYAYVTNSSANTISGFSIASSTGALTPLAGFPFSVGNGPSGITTDPAGKFLYVSNYTDNTISAFTINSGTGDISTISGSPYATGPGPKGLTVTPSGNYLYVADFSSANISAFSINATTGQLTAAAGSPFASGAGGGGTTAVAVHPGGGYAYTANNTNPYDVSGFSITTATGALTSLGGSPWGVGGAVNPNSITIDPNGKFLYVGNYGTGQVAAFTIDTSTGGLTAIGGSPYASGSGVQGVLADPTGKFLFATNGGANTISVFSIDASTGSIAPVGGSPFAAGSDPRGLSVAKVPQN